MSLFSRDWYRVKGLTPRLREHVQIARHEYRGQTGWVLYDPLSRRLHRFSPEAYELLARLDGTTSLDVVWATVTERLGDHAPTQDEVIGLLSQLHQADLLAGSVPPDSCELLTREEHRAKQRWHSRIAMPLFQQIRLVDPMPWLDRCLPILTPALCRGLLGLWAVVVSSGLLLGLQYWPQLSADVLDRVSTPESLLLWLCLYPILKLVHEAGHALAGRWHGCEIPELGIALNFGWPVPYVDATASTVLPNKYARMAIAGAGIAVDLFTASLALWVWINVEPGLIRTAAYDIVLLGGLSSLLFNGNPLLRFDGYFVLQDWLEIPNLGVRSARHCSYLLQRYVFLQPGLTPPPTVPGEARWLVAYGLSSWLFRTISIVTVLLLVGETYPVLGFCAAVPVVVLQWLWPLWRELRAVWQCPIPLQRRGLQSAIVLGVFAVVFVVPLPAWTTVEGVLMPPVDSIVRAHESGEVLQVLVAPEARVSPGQPLFQMDDPFVRGELAVLQARERELQVRYATKWMTEPVAAQKLQNDIETVQAEIRRLQERIDNLVVRSPSEGRVLITDVLDWPGRYVKQGEALAYVLPASGAVHAQVVVDQNHVAKVRDQTRAVNVRLANAPRQAVAATIVRATPMAVDRLPGSALGPGGGGSVAVDDKDEQGRKALERFFDFELALNDVRTVEQAGIGLRVYARFEHVAEPLAAQAFRRLRQLFLKRLNV
jgi:putative peptide zinc metalloprotease protein